MEREHVFERHVYTFLSFMVKKNNLSSEKSDSFPVIHVRRKGLRMKQNRNIGSVKERRERRGRQKGHVPATIPPQALLISLAPS